MDTTPHSIHVLLVDPEESFAKEVAEFLERTHDRFDVTVESGAEDALRRLREGDIDCVVSEHELSTADGLAMLRRVRERTDSLPFILFTSTGSEDVASDAISAGVTDYVRKTDDGAQKALLAKRIANAVNQHRAQDKARRIEQRLRELTESTNDVLWMFTPDFSDLLFVNSAYEEVWGQPVKAVRENPTHFLQGVHPDDRPRAQAAMEDLASGDPIELEYRVNAKENYSRWVWVQGEPVYDEEGSLTRVVGFVRDITNRKAYERQVKEAKDELERSNRSLREFAYIASHDLQEPLRMVSSFVGLLQDEYGDQFDDEAREYMDYAVDGAQRMKHMIDSLLQYSRIHTKAGEPERVETNEVLTDVKRDLQFFLDDHDGTLSIGPLPTVEADADQLRQVFQNLIKNALVHGGQNGSTPKIEIFASEGEDTHVFGVEDNGPGIPEKQQEEIFKIFRQGTEAASDNGTGIGLAISQRIVQRHGGEIWVESEPGDGATFKFTIPKRLTTSQDQS